MVLQAGAGLSAGLSEAGVQEAEPSPQSQAGLSLRQALAGLPQTGLPVRAGVGLSL